MLLQSKIAFLRSNQNLLKFGIIRSQNSHFASKAAKARRPAGKSHHDRRGGQQKGKYILFFFLILLEYFIEQWIAPKKNSQDYIDRQTAAY